MPARNHFSGAAREDATPLERLFYGEDCVRCLPQSYDEAADLIRYGEDRKLCVVPCGGGSRAYLGNPPSAPVVALSTRAFADVVRYEPGDFTVGVQAGAAFDDLRERLASHGQELPFDVPRGRGWTVGSVVAAALPGPRRAAYGPVGSFVIGVRGMRGGGRQYKAGGMVVKNVAGYEVGKFLCGSLGSAGVILEVNFKLRPLPAARLAALAGFQDPDAAWRTATELRRRRIDPAACYVVSGRAAARVREAAGVTGGAPYLLVWVYEGNGRTVEWLAAQAEGLLEGTGPAERSAVRDEGARAVLEALAALAEPELPLEEREALLRFSLLPEAAGPFACECGARMAESGARDAWWAGDALSGQVLAGWRGEEGELASPIAPLLALARQQAACAWVHYLPRGLRSEFPYILEGSYGRTEERIVRRVLRVFDPRGAFPGGRVLRRIEEA